MTTTDQEWLGQAVALAVRNVGEGGGPFGALVVCEGAVVSRGVNRVTRDLDPTAHAEVVAIRRACTALDTFSLAGCVLYTSCEPCPLCVSAALWARVDRVAYAADRDDAAAGGFDDREFYDLFGRDRSTWTMPVAHTDVDGSFTPFETWLADGDRTHY